MTYEQNIRRISKRLDAAHINALQAGKVIKKERAQAKEAIDITAEVLRTTLKDINSKLSHTGFKIDIPGTLFQNGLTQYE